LKLVNWLRHRITDVFCPACGALLVHYKWQRLELRYCPQCEKRDNLEAGEQADAELIDEELRSQAEEDADAD